MFPERFQSKDRHGWASIWCLRLVNGVLIAKYTLQVLQKKLRVGWNTFRAKPIPLGKLFDRYVLVGRFRWSAAVDLESDQSELR